MCLISGQGAAGTGYNNNASSSLSFPLHPVHPTLAAFPCIFTKQQPRIFAFAYHLQLTFTTILISSSAKMRYSIILPAFAAVALCQVSSVSVEVRIALQTMLTSARS